VTSKKSAMSSHVVMVNLSAAAWSATATSPSQRDDTPPTSQGENTRRQQTKTTNKGPKIISRHTKHSHQEVDADADATARDDAMGRDATQRTCAIA
jgi:hypothetical protein